MMSWVRLGLDRCSREDRRKWCAGFERSYIGLPAAQERRRAIKWGAGGVAAAAQGASPRPAGAAA